MRTLKARGLLLATAGFIRGGLGWPVEDEVPIVSDEPQDSVMETPAPEADTHPLEGFEEAFQGLGTQEEPEGQSEPSEAVDEEVVKDTPEVEEPAEAGEPDEKQASEADLEVNFDGYDDDDKTVWEQLLKKGHVTHDWYDKQRKGHLMHADYTRKTMKLAEDRGDLKTEREKDESDLNLLKTIRENEHLHDIWMKMQRGEYQAPDGDDDGLISRKEAERLMENRESEKRARIEKRKKDFNGKLEEIREVAQGLMVEHDITADVMREYLQSEGQDFLDPDDEEGAVLKVDIGALRKGIMSRHRIAAAEAKAKKLEEQLTQRTSKAERTSKQSSPPPQRLSVKTPVSIKAKTLEELGVETDGSNVQGFGHPAQAM